MKTQYIVLLILLLTGIVSCQKQEEWLDVKVERSSVVPSRLSDYQSLLDGDNLYQQHSLLGLISTDQFYVTDGVYASISFPTERNGYIWAKEIYENRMPVEWSRMYQYIAVANICLEGLEKIPVNDQNIQQWKTVQGMSLFIRGHALYNLLQYFAKPYDVTNAATELGVPIRLRSDVNERPGRSSIEVCYQQVLKDLKDAEAVLPLRPAIKTRPGQAAVKGLLARVFLTMENWQESQKHAEAALGIVSDLMDFNTLSTTATLPFPPLQNNPPEIIFYAEGMSSSFYNGNNAIIDSLLYRSYANNDLRKSIFYRLVGGLPFFKGFYTGQTGRPFAGIATNELYLIVAETKTRNGDYASGLQVLNTLLLKRWRSGSFTPLTASNEDAALRLIISERRKELPFSANLIWEDLRRLNKDPRFARTMKRIIHGIVYEISPNDARYTFAIPEIEIQLTGIQQNKR